MQRPEAGAVLSDEAENHFSLVVPVVVLCIKHVCLSFSFKAENPTVDIWTLHFARMDVFNR